MEWVEPGTTRSHDWPTENRHLSGGFGRENTRGREGEREFSAIFRLPVPCSPLLLKFMGYFVAGCYDVMLLCSYWLMRHPVAEPESGCELQPVLKAPNGLI